MTSDPTVIDDVSLPATGNPRVDLLDSEWRFRLEEHIDDRSAAYSDAEQALLGFDGSTSRPDCINWLKTGRSYGPASRGFDDADWRTVDLPHDWSVEAVPRPDATPRNGFMPQGVGWYRKTVGLHADDLADDRRVALRFDGVFRDAAVFVNGHLVALHRSGYIGFTTDLANVLVPGDNAIAVRVDASAKEGWFYEGAGIYRHVWLIRSSRARFVDDGVRIDTAIDVDRSDAPGTLDASVEVENDTVDPVDATLAVTLVDPDGQAIARAEQCLELAPGEQSTVAIDTLSIASPLLWSPASPHLYRLDAELTSDGRVLDRIARRVGLRDARFDADRGFLLNSEPLKLKGVCVHQDHAGVGVAVPDGLLAWRLERLQAMGCNAIRTGHHPPAPELLELCDERGILVLDEVRCFGASAEAEEQLARSLRRDRCHPSVIAWSLANEEMVVQHEDIGRRMFERFKRVAARHDTTRPFTAAVNGPKKPSGGFVDAVDVHGVNYPENDIDRLDAVHRARPELPIVVAEASSAVSTRGEFLHDPAAGYVAEYDRHAEPPGPGVVNWPFWGAGAEDSWAKVAEREYLAGAFVWTGFDYRGEQTPYVRWPSIVSHFGIMDLCGFAKSRFHYYRAWWSGRDALHLLPHWTWPGQEGRIIDVWCYTNARSVQLVVNGEPQERRDVPKNGHVEWRVEYQPGFIEAIAQLHDGREIVERVETAGAAHAIRLGGSRHVDRHGFAVTVARAEVVDAGGRVVPHASHRLRFETAGRATIIGLGNGDPNSHEPDQLVDGVGHRRVFNGLAQVILKASAASPTTVLTASAKGLRSASITTGKGENKPSSPSRAKPAALVQTDSTTTLAQ
ncbi:MAG: glycoside hydrolase family 2 TIM barrel-domain containing protein [Planctomycetota bacterium]